MRIQRTAEGARTAASRSCPWYMLTSGPRDPAQLELAREHLIMRRGPPSAKENDWHLEAVERINTMPLREEWVHGVEPQHFMPRQPLRQWADRHGAHISLADHMRRMTTPIRKGSS